jgi:hypothetical protein
VAKGSNGSVYSFAQELDLMDYWLATNFDSKKNQLVSSSAVLKLINSQNNIQFEFSNGQEANVDYSTRGKFFTDTNLLSPNLFTKLIFNKEALRPIDLTALFNRLKTLDNIILSIKNPDNENNFFNFKVVEIVNHSSHFEFEIKLFNNFYLGALIAKKKYNIFFDMKNNSAIESTKVNSYFPSGW